MLKTVYRSSCRDKHNCQQRDSNLGPLTPQSDVLTTRVLRPAMLYTKVMRHLPVDTIPEKLPFQKSTPCLGLVFRDMGLGFGLLGHGLLRLGLEVIMVLGVMGSELVLWLRVRIRSMGADDCNDSFLGGLLSREANVLLHLLMRFFKKLL